MQLVVHGEHKRIRVPETPNVRKPIPHKRAVVPVPSSDENELVGGYTFGKPRQLAVVCRVRPMRSSATARLHESFTMFVWLSPLLVAKLAICATFC